MSILQHIRQFLRLDNDNSPPDEESLTSLSHGIAEMEAFVIALKTDPFQFHGCLVGSYAVNCDLPAMNLSTGNDLPVIPAIL